MWALRLHPSKLNTKFGTASATCNPANTVTTNFYYVMWGIIDTANKDFSILLLTPDVINLLASYFEGVTLCSYYNGINYLWSASWLLASYNMGYTSKVRSLWYYETEGEGATFKDQQLLV